MNHDKGCRIGAPIHECGCPCECHAYDEPPEERTSPVIDKAETCTCGHQRVHHRGWQVECNGYCDCSVFALRAGEPVPAPDHQPKEFRARRLSGVLGPQALSPVTVSAKGGEVSTPTPIPCPYCNCEPYKDQGHALSCPAIRSQPKAEDAPPKDLEEIAAEWWTGYGDNPHLGLGRSLEALCTLTTLVKRIHAQGFAAGQKSEREAVVRWLARFAVTKMYAGEVERGDHLRKEDRGE